MEKDKLLEKIENLEKENELLKIEAEKFEIARRWLGCFFYDFSQSMTDDCFEFYRLGEAQQKILYKISKIFMHSEPEDHLDNIYDLTKLLELEGINNRINPYIACNDLFKKNWRERLKDEKYHNNNSPMCLNNKIEKVIIDENHWTYKRVL